MVTGDSLIRHGIDFFSFYIKVSGNFIFQCCKLLTCDCVPVRKLVYEMGELGF